MSNYPKSTTSNSLPKIEAANSAESVSERTPRSESQSSKPAFGVFFGVLNGRPFATLHKNRDGYEPEPVYAHTPDGWTIGDFFGDLQAALAKLEEAKAMIARYC